MEEQILKAYVRLAYYVTGKYTEDVLSIRESDIRAIDEVLKSLNEKYPYGDTIRINFRLDGQSGNVEDVMQHFGVSYAVAYGRIKSSRRKLSRLEGSRFNVFNNLFRSTLEEQMKNSNNKIQDLEVSLQWKSEEAENWKILFLSQISIEKLEIQGKATRRLVEAGITTIGALVSKTESELLAMEDFGLVMLRRVKSALADSGLCLKGEKTRLMPWEKVAKEMTYLFEKIGI